MELLKIIKKSLFEIITKAEILEISNRCDSNIDSETHIYKDLFITIKLPDNDYGIPKAIRFEQTIKIPTARYYNNYDYPIKVNDTLPVVIKAYKIKKTKIKDQYLCYICLELFADCNSSAVFFPAYTAIILTSNIAVWRSRQM